MNELDEFITQARESEGFDFLETLKDEDQKYVYGYDMEADKFLIDMSVFPKDAVLSEENEDYIEEFGVNPMPVSVATVDELKEIMCQHGGENWYVFDGDGMDYISAVVAIDKNTGRPIYDFNLMVDYLLEYGQSEEDAEDFISYDTMRALPYYKGPIVVAKDF